MSRPTPGKPYKTQSGDTMESIAAKAYGLTSKWALIRDANQLEYTISNPSDIQENETIFIPEDPEILQLRAQREN